MKWLFMILAPPLLAMLSGCYSGAENDLEKYRMPTEVPGPAALTQTAQTEIAASRPPADCPVTAPQDPAFIPPQPYSKLEAEENFWYGSNSLWVSLPQSGVWSELPRDSHGYTQKLPWWREGYIWNEEPEPPLIVTGERLDGESQPLDASTANGAYAEEAGSAMTMGVAFPSLGCWKITGKYQDAELSFVVWLAP